MYIFKLMAIDSNGIDICHQLYKTKTNDASDAKGVASRAARHMRHGYKAYDVLIQLYNPQDRICFSKKKGQWKTHTSWEAMYKDCPMVGMQNKV